MSDTVTNNEYKTSPGPYASRETWESAVRDNQPNSRQGNESENPLSGLDAIDPVTGMLRSESGMDEDEYRRLNAGGIPPNPALYLTGIMDNPAKYDAEGEKQSDWAYFTHLSRTLREGGDKAVALLRQAGNDGFSKTEAVNERGAINGDYRGFTVVGDTEGQAKMARKIIDFSMDFRRTDSQLNPIKPMMSVGDLPPQEALNQLAKDIKPDFERGKEVAVILPPFMRANAVAEWVKQNPSIANSPLIVPGTATERDYLSRQGLNVVDHKPTELPDGGKKDRAWFQARNDAITNAIRTADRVAVAYRAPNANSRGKDELMEASARALTMGKLVHYGIADTNGNYINKMDGASATHHITSGKEAAQHGRNLDRIKEYETDIGDKYGAAAFGLIMGASGHKRIQQPISNADTIKGYNALRDHHEEVPNFSTAYEMANNINGKAFLRDIGVPAKVVQRLGEGNLIADMLPLAASQVSANERNGIRQAFGNDIGDNQSFLVYSQGDQKLLSDKKGVYLYADNFSPEENKKILESELFKGDNKGHSPVYVEGLSAPTNPADVPEKGILVARTGAAFTSKTPKLSWEETSIDEITATHEQDIYKIRINQGGNKENNNIQLFHADATKDPEKFEIVTSRSELPDLSPMAPHNRTENEQHWNKVEWERALQTIKSSAVKNAMDLQEARRPDLQAIREVRKAFAEKGAVIYPAPASFRTVHWNTQTSNYQIELSDHAGNSSSHGKVTNAVGLSDKTVVVQDNNRGATLGQVASINAQYGKPALTVAWPSQEQQSNPNEVKKFIGNGIIANLPYDDAGKRLKLNFDDAHAMSKAWGNTRPNRLDLDTGKVITPAQKDARNIDISR